MDLFRFREKHSPQKDCGPSQRVSVAMKYSMVSFYQFSSVAQLGPTLCDLMDCSTPGFPVHHQLPKLAQTHVQGVGDTIQPSHHLSSSMVTPKSKFMSRPFCYRHWCRLSPPDFSYLQPSTLLFPAVRLAVENESVKGSFSASCLDLIFVHWRQPSLDKRSSL